MRAAGAAVEGRAPSAQGAVELEFHEWWLVGRPALVADAPHETLRLDPDNRRGDHEGLDAHLEEAVDGADGIGGVQRRQNEVTGQRRLHRNLRGFLVANLSNQDGVRVLAEDR